jgi:hypothetical protein
MSGESGTVTHRDPSPPAPADPEGPEPRGIGFDAVDEESGEATVLSCPLCGGRFTHGNLVCATCPMNLGCEIVRCPSCGYQFPRSSRIVDWARRLLFRVRRETP